MRVLFSVIACMISVTGFSQDTTETVPVYQFKVRNPKMEVVVEEKDSVMYTDYSNFLRITVTGKNKIGPVTLDGGEITRNGSNFTIKVKEGTACLLAVYVIKPNGKIELALSKRYRIVYLADPVPMIRGVKADSIIARHELLESDFMVATLTRFGKTTMIKILSFEMQAFMDSVEVGYKSIGDHFSPEMRRHVQILKPGVPLYFKEIICRMPDGTPRKLENMRIFVDCSPRYRFIRE